MSDRQRESCSAPDELKELEAGDRVLFSAPRSFLDGSYDDSMVRGTAAVAEINVERSGLKQGQILTLTLVSDEKVREADSITQRIPEGYGYKDVTGRLMWWNSGTSPGLKFTVTPIGHCRKLPVDEKVVKLCAKTFHN